MIRVDGTMGEGGGQVLRTSLALSAITGEPIEITNIRGKRSKPGLQRQHLACVKAAAAVCDGYVEGAELNSSRLLFEPTQPRSGVWNWNIGSAGSTTLVAQTVIPILLGRGDSTLTIEGGTHNPMAPSADFLIESYCRAMRQFGAQIDVVIEQPGFAPVGGGKLRVNIQGVDFNGAAFDEPGSLQKRGVLAASSGLAHQIALTEVEAALAALGWKESDGTAHTWKAIGPGNVVSASLQYEHITAHFTELGQKGVQAEAVAKRLARQVASYLGSDAVVCPHLADQLMIPIALFGGSFVAGPLTLHSHTQLELIPEFLDVEFAVEAAPNKTCRVMRKA